jgi:N-acyl-phosphatidylethanolamine-hydrolysing phospholipase D
VYPNDGALLRANGNDPTVTWIGHATVLLQLDGLNILTDPHWGDAVGPVRVPGLRRLVPPGLEFDHLPRIDAVVISHDHWDHLDLATVRRLAARWQPTFFVPLGLRPLLADAGARGIVELDWWQSASLGPARFTATPAQHTSGRGIGDQGLRLWSSWMISSDGRSVFFAGDTGYHRGFVEMRQRLGAPDIAVLPIGGYLTHDGQHPNHMNPEEAVRAFRDLGARRLVPMHWGTFELNHEPFGEPPARLRREATQHAVAARLAILAPGETLHW